MHKVAITKQLIDMVRTRSLEAKLLLVARVYQELGTEAAELTHTLIMFDEKEGSHCHTCDKYNECKTNFSVAYSNLENETDAFTN
jgi:hypothetical protein